MSARAAGEEDAGLNGISSPRAALRGCLRPHAASRRALRAAPIAVVAALLCAAAVAPPAGARLLRPARSRVRSSSAPVGARSPSRHLRRAGTAQAAVVGGQIAGSATFPWLVYVLDFKGREVGQCTGTVIAANLVLTAGHCGEEVATGSVDPASGYRVVSATTDWSSESERQVSGVSRVIVYPGFDPGSLTGDAALLVLSTPTGAPPIGLATEEGAGLSAAGTEAVVAGWGRTYPQEAALTRRLRWAATVVQRSGYCERNSAPFYRREELCAIDPPTFASGPCEGDSGGPLIANGPSGPVEIGLVSHGPADCATTQPSVYTRVQAISSWAQEWIAAMASGSASAASGTSTGAGGRTSTSGTLPRRPAGAVHPSSAFPGARAPADGRYHGTAGARHAPIALVIGSHGRRVTAIAARLAYRCRSARTLRSSLEALSNGESEPIGRRGRFVLRLAAGGERVTIRGAVGPSADVMHGTITGVDRHRRSGRCRTGRIAWTARRSAVSGAASGHVRPGAYSGLTEQGGSVELRVSHDGGRLVRLRFTGIYRCPSRRRLRLTRTLLSRARPSTLEASGGFTVRLTGARARGRVDGTFGLLGGLAFGTLKASVATRLGRCRTGLIGWQARR